MENPLIEMQRLGQSTWHDNIRRDLLTGGALSRMVADGWITGLTSNPTIFQKAIAESDEYDDQLRELALAGESAEEIFERLAIDDIRAAADVFRGVYDRTGGADGFVSIEVAPKYARDTRTTIAETRRLWKEIDRPNLMVKIPATREGVPAIEESIARGININVTLIFSLDRYDAVMNAYLRGLERRHRAGRPIGAISSVASFFVSRVDTAIDKLIGEQIAAAGRGEASRLRGHLGKAGIANARLAYAAFRKKFGTAEAWAVLATAGARVQRPLWASTSTKNPDYPDVYYVEALIGPNTVDTLPPATIEAYADHGRPAVRIENDLDGARDLMAALDERGIDLDAVTGKLEVDGVRSFADSFDSLIEAVEERRVAILAAGRKRPRRAAAKKRRTRAAPRSPGKQPPGKARPKQEGRISAGSVAPRAAKLPGATATPRKRAAKSAGRITKPTKPAKRTTPSTERTRASATRREPMAAAPRKGPGSKKK